MIWLLRNVEYASTFAAGEFTPDLLGGIIANIAVFLAVEAVRHAQTQISVSRFRGAHCDSEMISNFLRLPLRPTGLVHLLAMTTFAGVALQRG
jgi:hypothetical protein